MSLSFVTLTEEEEKAMLRLWLCIVVATSTLFAESLRAQDLTAEVLKQLTTKSTTKEDTRIWKLSMTPSFVFSQVGLSNWAGGGQNSITVLGLFTASANYALNGTTWDNSLDLGYGVTRLGGSDWRKGDDRLILLSKLGIDATKELRYSAFLDFRTQIAPGRNFDRPEQPLISQFFSPAFLTLGAGLDWKPAPYFTALVSPLGGRGVFVLNDSLARAGAFGVTPGSNSQLDLGAVANLQYKNTIAENVALQSRLNLFARYKAIDQVVVVWENIVQMKVNSWLGITFATDVIYDHRVPITRGNGTVGPSTQLRNILGISIAQTFTN